MIGKTGTASKPNKPGQPHPISGSRRKVGAGRLGPAPIERCFDPIQGDWSMAQSTKLGPVPILRFRVLQNSHKPNEAVLLGLLYLSAALRKFSLRHNPTRNTLSNISLANVGHPKPNRLNACTWFTRNTENLSNM